MSCRQGRPRKSGPLCRCGSASHPGHCPLGGYRRSSEASPRWFLGPAVGWPASVPLLGERCVHRSSATRSFSLSRQRRRDRTARRPPEARRRPPPRRIVAPITLAPWISQRDQAVSVGCGYRWSAWGTLCQIVFRPGSSLHRHRWLPGGGGRCTPQAEARLQAKRSTRECSALSGRPRARLPTLRSTQSPRVCFVLNSLTGTRTR